MAGLRATLPLMLGAMVMTAPAMAQQAIDLSEETIAESGPNNEPLGWTQIVRPAEPGQGQTELDVLSRSTSGVTFGLDLYGSARDNPLEPVSVTLRALDKITATYKDLVVPIGEEAAFGALRIIPRTCDKRPPEETPETTVFLEVFSTTDDVQGARTRSALREEEANAAAGTSSNQVLPLSAYNRDRNETAPAAEGEDLAPIQDGVLVASADLIGGDADVKTSGQTGDNALFKGWMFASTPSLNALEHPVYDVWVTDCKMRDPTTGE